MILKGEIVIPKAADKGTAAEEAVNRLMAAIQAQSPTMVEKQGQGIVFGSALYRRVSRWNILNGIDHGSLSVLERPQELAVAYEITANRIFLVVTGVIAVVLLIVLFKSSPASAPVSLLSVCGVWVYCVGFFWVRLKYQFPRFLKKALDGVGR